MSKKLTGKDLLESLRSGIDGAREELEHWQRQRRRTELEINRASATVQLMELDLSELDPERHDN